MHVHSLLQNKFGLVFFRLFDGALETSNFRFKEARSAITLLRCFLHENTQCGKIARVKFAQELGAMSKNKWISLVRGPIWGIHSLTLMISCFYKRIFIQAALYFTISSLSVFIEEIGSLRSTTRRQRQRHKFCTFKTQENLCAPFTFSVHFFPVLRKFAT